MTTTIKRIYTSTIEFQTLIMPGADPKNYIALTTYNIAGQGKTIEEACKSALSIVSSHLYHYVQQQVESLPAPDVRLGSVDAAVKYFWKDITDCMLRTERPEDGKEMIIRLQQGILEAKVRHLSRIIQEHDKYLPRLIMDAYVLEIKKDTTLRYVH